MLSSIISEISNFKAYFVAPLFAAIIIVKLKFQRELSSRKKKKNRNERNYDNNVL